MPGKLTTLEDFKKRHDRENKDKEWEFDVKMYALWSKYADTVAIAAKRVEELKAKWPGQFK